MYTATVFYFYMLILTSGNDVKDLQPKSKVGVYDDIATHV